MNNFVHLHCHSNYSFLEGASRIEELVESARECGMRALAITDTHGLYGAIPFYRVARNAGIKPILGAELRPPYWRLIILARNREGYGKLCEIVTSFHISAGDGDAVPEDNTFAVRLRRILTDGEPDLCIILPACHATRVVCRRRLPKNIYLEIPAAAGPAEIGKLARLAGRLSLPPVATGPVLFTTPDRHEVHRVLTAIRTNTTVETIPDGALAPRDAFFRSGDEMRSLFAACPAALENAARIAAGCNLELELNRFHIPRLRLTNGETAYSQLCRLCLRGLARRYRPITRAALGRLYHELEMIERLDFSHYFLVVHDIVREARRRGIPIIGRGSAAGSIVSYCLEITHVDPIRHNLYFERFLNPERRSPPDIDLDFSWKRRDEIINYVYRKHGPENVAMISTLVTFGARSAVREIGKAMGVPEGDLTRWTGSLPHTNAALIEKATHLLPECRGIPLRREPLKTIVSLARAIDGYPRHLGVHAGGIVVTPFPLTRIVPLERAAKGVTVTQYEMRAAEEIGLVKIDLLGQRSLAVLEDTLKSIGENRGIRPPVEDFVTVSGDPATTALIRSGRTMGCFYIESPAMRQLLRKLDVTGYEELVAASSVIRPGVARSGMMQQYVRRHRGREKTAYLHPKMREILAETHGVMIYQEDVMRVAHLIAGMTLAEADLLRRAMSGKMRSRDAMNTVKEKFLAAASARGIAKKIAIEIWRQIESFAAYAFCKAHSASFALLSMQVAFLKAHWPAEFMAAVLSNGGGFYHTQAYLDEARRLGLRILPPDINRSDISFSSGDGWIRVGLMQVKDLKRGTMERIVQSRMGDGFFTSMAEFCRRVKPDRREGENLIKCGAFDAFELSRPELLWKLRLIGRDRSTEDLTSPPLPLEIASPCAIVPRIPDHDEKTKLALECEVLGVCASRHPLDAFTNRIADNGYIRACELGRHAGKRVELLGWLVCTKRVRTSNGDYMRFVTMEDTTALFEVVLFPRCYRRYGHLLKTPGPFAVRGRAADDNGCVVLNADRLRLLKPSPSQ